uniref:Uncharacterized protein n=1 Tax=Rhizophora mucronata TaxID=61149 RepID=A0A2P2QS11_RHIMU
MCSTKVGGAGGGRDFSTMEISLVSSLAIVLPSRKKSCVLRCPP